MKKLYEQRKAAVEAMNDLLPKEGEAFDSDAKERFDQAAQAVEAIDAKIEAHRKANDLGTVREALAQQAGITEDEAENRRLLVLDAFRASVIDGSKGCPKMSEAQREVLSAAVSRTKERVERMGPDALMGMDTGAGSGGELVPTEVASEVYSFMDSTSVVRAGATVRTSITGRTVNYPVIDDSSNEGEVTAEGTDATDEDVGTTNRPLQFFNFGSKVVPISLELLQDSEARDLPGIINELLTERIASIQERVWTEAVNNAGGAAAIVGYVQEAGDGGTTAAAGCGSHRRSVSDGVHSCSPCRPRYLADAAVRVLRAAWLGQRQRSAADAAVARSCDAAPAHAAVRPSGALQ